MWKEFKAFAMRGPVLDMAVGIIIGAAFGQIITSLVNDVIMPPIGMLLGRVDFNNFFIALSKTHFANVTDAKKAGAVVILYGHFVNTVIDFILVAACVFLVVKGFNSMKKSPPPETPAAKDCPYCISSIPVKATRCPHCTSQLASA